MDIAVAYIIQVVWFGDIPLWTSILGALVVIMAVFTMSLEDAFLTFLKSIFGSSGWCWNKRWSKLECEIDILSLFCQALKVTIFETGEKVSHL